jgi:hypothetical protein
VLAHMPHESTEHSKIVAESLEPPMNLEYPHPPSPVKNSNNAMPLILGSLGVLVGVVVLLVRMPTHAPTFEQLTQYTCDPVPRLPLAANRLGTYPLEFKCQAGDQILYQHQAVTNRSNPSGLYACKQAGELMRIWRMAPPSPYGAYVFHSTCGSHVIMYYKHRAATYESIQQFVIALASLLILGGAIGISVSLAKSVRRHRRTSNDT